MPSTTQPRTEAECRATVARLRREAAGMRNLLGDPGEGGDVLQQFTQTGPALAQWKEDFANALEAIAAD